MNIYIRIGLCIIGAYVLAVAMYNLSIADGNLEVYVTNVCIKLSVQNGQSSMSITESGAVLRKENANR